MHAFYHILARVKKMSIWLSKKVWVLLTRKLSMLSSNSRLSKSMIVITPILILIYSEASKICIDLSWDRITEDGPNILDWIGLLVGIWILLFPTKVWGFVDTIIWSLVSLVLREILSLKNNKLIQFFLITSPFLE